MMTHYKMVEVLKKKQGELSLRQFAQKLGLSAAYLSDVYRGNRQAGRRLLKLTGMHKIVTVKVDYFLGAEAVETRRNGAK
jgi:transcriptional regulator with XRE-family HTH domain